MANSYPANATAKELEYLQQHPPLSDAQERRLLDTPVAMLAREFKGVRPRDWLRLYGRLLRRERPAEMVDVSLKNAAQKRMQRAQEGAYAHALKRISELEQQIDVLAGFDDVAPDPLVVPAKKLRNGKIGKAGALCVAISDWHAAEEIKSRNVGGLNKFNLDICRARVARLTESIIKLWEHNREHAHLTTLMVALLGDLANGELREESVATNLLGPIDEIYFAQALILGMIDKLVDAVGPKVQLLVPVIYGNHGRLTEKLQYKRIKETSVEYILALNLNAQYKDTPNVDVRVSDGNQQIVDLFGHKVRLHHGNAATYNRGTGGIYPSVKTLIRTWNSAQPCAFDMFGHFHGYTAPVEFLCNGSLCGYNEYAIARGFQYGPACQGATIVDAIHGRRGSWPIYVGD